MDLRRDSELIIAFLQGETSAFNEIDRRYRRRLERFVVRQALDRLIPAEELVQETLNRAWQNLSSLKDTEALAPWLFRIAARIAIDISRSRLYRISTTSFSESFSNDSDSIREASVPDPHEKTPQEQLIQKEERLNFWHTAQSILSEEEFQIVWLFYIEEYSTSEIAEMYHEKIGTIRVRLHRARKKLADTYRE